MTILRRLGGSGLSIAPLVLGGNVFGWTADEPTSFAILDAFVDGGGTMIDTADQYSAWLPGHQGGESETVIGAWLKASGKRDRVQIATKVGNLAGKLAPDAIRAGIEGSLRRLGTDHVDVYFAHRDDADTPLADSLGAFDGLVREGKVRALGASNYSAARIDEALAISARDGLTPFTVLQPEYSLVERAGFEAEVRGIASKRDLGVVTYFALAAGFLSGKYRSKADVDGTERAVLVERYVDERGLAILAEAEAVASELGVPIAQVAIAWIVAQPGVTAPIASARNLDQLEQLLAGMRLTLDADQLARLDTVSRS